MISGHAILLNHMAGKMAYSGKMAYPTINLEMLITYFLIMMRVSELSQTKKHSPKYESVISINT